MEDKPIIKYRVRVEAYTVSLYPSSGGGSCLTSEGIYEQIVKELDVKKLVDFVNAGYKK